MNNILLVTGGSRGIGAAIARLAAQQGYTVAISYLSNQTAAQSVVDSIHQQGGTALAIQADVAQETDVLRLFKQVDASLGRLTALVNNAGVLDKQCRVEAMTAERMQRIFATNVLGSFLCAREAVKRLSTRYGGQGGGIINISSRAAQLGSPNEYVDYAASKAALETLTIGLAKEVAGEGIRVNAVSPGIIDTDIHASGGDPQRAHRSQHLIPLQRPGTSDEIAQAVLWLLSDQASYVTGAIIPVSGGR